jgi:hypothetical protein
LEISSSVIGFHIELTVEKPQVSLSSFRIRELKSFLTFFYSQAFRFWQREDYKFKLMSKRNCKRRYRLQMKIRVIKLEGPHIQATIPHIQPGPNQCIDTDDVNCLPLAPQLRMFGLMK